MTAYQFRLFVRAVPWLLVALAAGVAVRIGLSVDTGLSALSDARVYRAGVLAWLHGEDLYRTFVSAKPAPYTYPPFSLLPFGVLLGWYPLGAFVLTAGSAAAMFHTFLLVLARLRPALPHRALVAAVGTVCAMEFQPMTSTLFWGQINVFLLWLVAVDCLHRNPRHPRGLLIGIAAAIKLTPLVFVLYFLLGRQVRPAVVAVAGFAACTGLGWLVAPHASADYWTRAMWDPTRVGDAALPDNQSLRGFLARLGPPLDTTLLWAVLVVVVTGLAVVAVVRFRRAGRDAPAWLAVAALGTLVSPMSWTHHWVWLLPLLLVATVWVGQAPRLAVPAVVLITCPALFTLPERFPAAPGTPWWTHVAGEGYVVVGCLVLAGLALLPRRFLPSGEPAPPPDGDGAEAGGGTPATARVDAATG